MHGTVRFGPAQLDSRIAQSVYFSRLIHEGKISRDRAHQVISDSLSNRLLYNGMTGNNPELAVEWISQGNDGVPERRVGTLTATRLASGTIDFVIENPQGIVPASIFAFLTDGFRNTPQALNHVNDYCMALYSVRMR